MYAGQPRAHSTLELGGFFRLKTHDITTWWEYEYRLNHGHRRLQEQITWYQNLRIHELSWADAMVEPNSPYSLMQPRCRCVAPAPGAQWWRCFLNPEQNVSLHAVPRCAVRPDRSIVCSQPVLKFVLYCERRTKILESIENIYPGTLSI